MNQSLEFYKNIFTTASIGMVVCDDSGQCVEANEAMGRIIGGTREFVLSQNYHHIKSWEETDLLETILYAVETNKIQCKEVTLTTSFGHQVSLDFHIIPFVEEEQKYLLFLVYDITKRKQAEVINEALVEKLPKAIEEIKSLQGIIPICMHCKQIRDDKGFWHRVEIFIEKHSEAKFSHGICSSCLNEFHPNIGEIRNKKK